MGSQDPCKTSNFPKLSCPLVSPGLGFRAHHTPNTTNVEVSNINWQKKKKTSVYSWPSASADPQSRIENGLGVC